MSFYLELHKAEDIKRDADGQPYYWVNKRLIKRFTDPTKFLEYVKQNGRKLKDVVAFSGSSTLLKTANNLIAEELQRGRVSQ